MQPLKFLLPLFLLLSLNANAKDSSGFGLSVGSGIPYLGQGGVHFRLSEKITFYGGYNILSLSTGSAKAELTMPEVLVQYHPFSGSFFVGGGLGQEALVATAQDADSGQEVRAEVNATTAIAKLGWMWGASNGGFWFGIDVSYVIPMSPETTITAPGVPQNDPDYQDVEDAANRFGETSYFNFTFARLGYIF